MVGAGGIGGLVAALLARQGEQVVVVLRPESVAAHQGSFRVQRPGEVAFTVPVAAVARVEEPVDVLWVTVKAAGLDGVRDWVADPATVGLVVPQLNGIDHVAELRKVFPRVAASTISVESERPEPGQIVQRTPMCRIGIAGLPGETMTDGEPSVDAVADLVAAAGMTVVRSTDEPTLLWSKLCFLGPAALATTAHDAPFGEVRELADYLGCRDEAFAAARAAGARVDEDAIRSAATDMMASMRTSMQKDVDAGRPPELDAIAGPILRGAAAAGMSPRHTEALVASVRGRLRSG